MSNFGWSISSAFKATSPYHEAKERMALALQSFAVRQAMGEWAEKTAVNYFATHPKARIRAFAYGERWGGKKKKDTDATNRPDLLLIETDRVRSLLDKDGVDVTKLNLLTLPDDDPSLRAIVRKALVALEVKISFRYYVKKHVNFIIDEIRKKRYETWLSQTENVGDVVAWFTLDKAFVTPMENILANGKEEERTYESRGRMARVKMTYNLPVERTTTFADVTNVDLNKTLRAVMKRGTTGGVSFQVVDDLGRLENVNLAALRKLAKETRRHPSSRKSKSSQSEKDRIDRQRL